MFSSSFVRFLNILRCGEFIFFLCLALLLFTLSILLCARKVLLLLLLLLLLLFPNNSRERASVVCVDGFVFVNKERNTVKKHHAFFEFLKCTYLAHTAMMMVHTWIDEGARNGHTLYKKRTTRTKHKTSTTYTHFSFVIHPPPQSKKRRKKKTCGLWKEKKREKTTSINRRFSLILSLFFAVVETNSLHILHAQARFFFCVRHERKKMISSAQARSTAIGSSPAVVRSTTRSSSSVRSTTVKVRAMKGA